MCNYCLSSTTRRHILRGFAAGFGTLAAGRALAGGNSPKPENVLTPDEALVRLLRGDERWVRGTTSAKRFGELSTAIANAQNPYAAILSCADSRVSPELIFDEHQGDLFVTRVAGNYVTASILASLEYAVAVLKTPLIFILGHTNCGALASAVKAYEQNSTFPGHIHDLVTQLEPAVAASAASGVDDLLARATIENVRLNTKKLASSTPVLRSAIRDRRLQIAGGVYQLENGKVEIVA